MNGTCFAIMPFEGRFNPVYDAIAEAVHACGLMCRRGDSSRAPGSIFDQIIREIDSAQLVIADLTDTKPNVMFELGAAYTILGKERTILISQNKLTIPSDLIGMRYVIYDGDTHALAKLTKELQVVLADALKTVQREESRLTIHGNKLRTERIVEDLQSLRKKHLDQPGEHQLTIRNIAGLSSLAIDDDEPVDPHDKSALQYHELLKEERDQLVAFVRDGASFRAILSPPTIWFPPFDWRRLDLRYRRMIEIIGSADSLWEKCEFVVVHSHNANTLILGNDLMYTGLKRGNSRGFNLTYRTTFKAEITDETANFESLFAEGRKFHEQVEPGKTLKVAVVERLTRLHNLYLASTATT